MDLLHVNRFANAFAQEAKTEGYALFARGETRLLGDDDVRVQFRVADEEDCWFEIRAKVLKLGCTCEEAQQGIPCRHLWSAFTFLEETRCLFSQNLRFADDVELDQEHFKLPARELLSPPPPAATTDSSVAATEARSDKARRIAYVVEVASLDELHTAFVTRTVQYRKGKGRWKPAGGISWDDELQAVGTNLDHQLHPVFSRGAGGDADLPLFADIPRNRIALASTELAELLPRLAKTGRFFLQQRRNQLQPLVFGGDVAPVIRVAADGDDYVCQLEIADFADTIHAVLDNGLLLSGNSWYRFETSTAALPEWIRLLQQRRRLPAREVEQRLERLHPNDFRRCFEVTVEECETPPFQPVLALGPHALWQPRDRFGAALQVCYNGAERKADPQPALLVNLAQGVWFVRDHEAEAVLINAFRARPGAGRDSIYGEFYVQNKRVERLLTDLEADGWTIRWSGQPVIPVSGVELDVAVKGKEILVAGDVVYDEQRIALTEILGQWGKDRSFLDLGNNRVGAFPVDWLSAAEGALTMGQVKRDTISFDRTGTGAVQMLVEAADVCRCDRDFEEIRARLTRPRDDELDLPATFQGTLRSYQSEGVAWLQYLRGLGFGALLADDMGLGKTIQALAALETRRGTGMALVVVPRSLLGNWRREAERFTPAMRVLVHHGTNRQTTFEDVDLILTTYATLRNDIGVFQPLEFDTCILDEAQAIKNRWTQSSRCVQSIRAKHRIALTGTPVQNHVGEIANIFDFLNPGVLSQSRSLKAVLNPKLTPTAGEIELFAKAVGPFVLRRLKEDVEIELPPKTVQDIWCDLDGSHHDAYRELLDEIKSGVSSRIAADGWGKSKMHVFEAMTRLRLCACHPGLGALEARPDCASAKIELLLEMVAEVIESGRKALVFSQFTSLLAFVRERFEANGVAYEYLDGQTRNRDERIERFQSDPDCPVFLLSLKAGGLGLNLTAAEYVFILDPWWNPAAEQQAIDRAHRIGQEKPVFVYRIFAADTIEHRVVQLQAEKDLLVRDVLGNAASVAREIEETDLDLLFS